MSHIEIERTHAPLGFFRNRLLKLPVGSVGHNGHQGEGRVAAALTCVFAAAACDVDAAAADGAAPGRGGLGPVDEGGDGGHLAVDLDLAEAADGVTGENE